MPNLNYYHEAVSAVVDVIEGCETVDDTSGLYDRLDDIEQQVNEWLQGDDESAALNRLIGVARDVLDNT